MLFFVAALTTSCVCFVSRGCTPLHVVKNSAAAALLLANGAAVNAVDEVRDGEAYTPARAHTHTPRVRVRFGVREYACVCLSVCARVTCTDTPAPCRMA